MRLDKSTGGEHHLAVLAVQRTWGCRSSRADKKQKKKRRARLIGSLDMGLRPLGQSKDVLDFRTFLFFFFSSSQPRPQKKAPKEACRHSSAKGERRSGFDWPWLIGNEHFNLDAKGIKRAKAKTLTQSSPNRRLISSRFIIHSHIFPLHVSSFHLGASCTG